MKTSKPLKENSVNEIVERNDIIPKTKQEIAVHYPNLLPMVENFMDSKINQKYRRSKKFASAKYHSPPL